jgi:hypothetical protein
LESTKRREESKVLGIDGGEKILKWIVRKKFLERG